MLRFKSKEGMKKEDFYTELGAGASCIKRRSLAVDNNCNAEQDDGNYKGLLIGNAWFGLVEAVVEAVNAGGQAAWECIFQVKGSHALFPKSKINNVLSDAPGGMHVVLV